MAGSSFNFNQRFYESQTFTSNGTFNVPDGVNLVWVEMYGGGGSGASGGSNSLQNEAYGGEAGTFVSKAVSVTPGSSVSVNIGSGGASVVSSIGQDGSATSFGSIKAPGGKGGARPPVDGEYYHVLQNGTGVGRDSIYASGGQNFVGATNFRFGGDAAYGDGGDSYENVSNPAEAGGIGAGGGSSPDANNSGAGGNGICIVYWREES